MFRLFLLCVLHAAFADPESSRIVGGRTANKGQYPYQVSVRDRSTSDNHNHVCGGVIIGYKDILTAAQCVRDASVSNVYIIAGTTSLSKDEDPDAVRISAKKITIHPSYSSKTGEKKSYNDVAIIRLEKSLPYRDDIQPASLLQDAPKGGANCVVSGWGITSGSDHGQNKPTKLLRAADVYYVRNQDCGERVTSIEEDQVCAEPTGDQAEGACDLDNGGPLYCEEGLLGVYSWSLTSCGTPESPGVYSSIPYHYEWIIQNSETAKTTTRRPSRSTTPRGGGRSTTRAPPTKPDQPETGLILAIIQVILICVILLVLFVLVAVVRK